MLLDDLIQNLIRLLGFGIHHPSSRPDIVREFLLDQLLDDERLEQFKSHLFRQTTLVQLEFRTDHDDRPSGVVHTLSEKILTETSLLSLQGIGEGAKRSTLSGRSRRRSLPATSTVVEKSIHDFLQHALLIACDDFWRTDSHQFLQTIVPVDDATIEIIQIGCRETASIQSHHRPQIRRNDRDHSRKHPFEFQTGLLESLINFQSLQRLLGIGRLTGIQLRFQSFDFGRDIDSLENFPYRFRTDAGRKDLSEPA